jgi:hypothetical protein
MSPAIPEKQWNHATFVIAASLPELGVVVGSVT